MSGPSVNTTFVRSVDKTSLPAGRAGRGQLSVSRFLIKKRWPQSGKPTGGRLRLPRCNSQPSFGQWFPTGLPGRSRCFSISKHAITKHTAPVGLSNRNGKFHSGSANVDRLGKAVSVSYILLHNQLAATAPSM